ncbi:TetR/AcrR family transcriptional regulator [Amycolatopsis sp. H20-H5]|uniref:TetR/AcrR family transcriptional regulator n=1 Tax=Amycolatopsis sp. H20-H5 TaxID=3046309 RepID=UPI002DB7CCED|nr:TetR/AcrR family transcriptional regulator [Amycolatopsis sp. H20-H5]MEC3975004.1 TetR/AcrR family transcriptional regulator [Amycolatopsis sp. H20-H5]
MTADHRKGPRRRGDKLNDAIYAATIDELKENGYPALTMDRVADRARTSKASLYRRWANKTDLVMDALVHSFPTPEELPTTGTLRGDLVAVLRHMATIMAGPLGEVARRVLADSIADPEISRLARQRFVDRRHDLFLKILCRSAERGEVRAGALTPRVASVGPCLLRDYFLLNSTPIPDSVIDEIVDDVLIPLVAATT